MAAAAAAAAVAAAAKGCDRTMPYPLRGKSRGPRRLHARNMPEVIARIPEGPTFHARARERERKRGRERRFKLLERNDAKYGRPGE